MSFAPINSLAFVVGGEEPHIPPLLIAVIAADPAYDPGQFNILRNALQFGNPRSGENSAQVVVDGLAPQAAELQKGGAVEMARVGGPVAVKKKRTSWRFWVGDVLLTRKAIGPQDNCPVCNLGGLTWTQLKIHCRTHKVTSGIATNIHRRKYIRCRVCRVLCPSWEALKEHEATHELFNCRWCNKSFLVKSAREAHERQHTGERPYRCASCPKQYANLPGLYYHLRRFSCHGPQPYKNQRSPRKMKERVDAPPAFIELHIPEPDNQTF